MQIINKPLPKILKEHVWLNSEVRSHTDNNRSLQVKMCHGHGWHFLLTMLIHGLSVQCFLHQWKKHHLPNGSTFICWVFQSWSWFDNFLESNLFTQNVRKTSSPSTSPKCFGWPHPPASSPRKHHFLPWRIDAPNNGFGLLGSKDQPQARSSA